MGRRLSPAPGIYTGIYNPCTEGKQSVISDTMANASGLGRVLILDNFDSFTWNIAHGLCQSGMDVTVRRADDLDLPAIELFSPNLLVISPGPGTPSDAVLSMAAIERFAGIIPIWGVCLGMQCLALAFGGQVGQGGEPVHGKTSLVQHDGQGIFTGLPSPLSCGRYHSLCITAMPRNLELSAWIPADGTVMALRHPDMKLSGVQFHPDSFLTQHAGEMFANAARLIL